MLGSTPVYVPPTMAVLLTTVNGSAVRTTFMLSTDQPPRIAWLIVFHFGPGML